MRVGVVEVLVLHALVVVVVVVVVAWINRCDRVSWDFDFAFAGRWFSNIGL